MKAQVEGCTVMLNLGSVLSVLGCFFFYHFGGGVYRFSLYAGISIVRCLVLGSRNIWLAFLFPSRHVCKCEVVHIVFTVVWQNLCSGLYLAGSVSASLCNFKAVVRGGATSGLESGLHLWMFPFFVSEYQEWFTVKRAAWQPHIF